MQIVHSIDTFRKFAIRRLSFEALAQEDFLVSVDHPVALVALHHPYSQVGEGKTLRRPAKNIEMCG